METTLAVLGDDCRSANYKLRWFALSLALAVSGCGDAPQPVTSSHRANAAAFPANNSSTDSDRDDGTSESSFATRKDALLSRYRGDVVVPEDLLKAFAKFVDDVDAQVTEQRLKAHCLPGSVRITTAMRPEKTLELGGDMNIPFLRSGQNFDGGHILFVRKEDDDCYFIRNGYSGLYFVRTGSGKWKMYRYFDKPIQ